MTIQTAIEETANWANDLVAAKKRVKELEAVLRECVDDKLFCVWFTDKYHKINKILEDR